MSQKGTLKINGKDAYTEWGVFLLDGSKSTLMMPAATKSLITNESRLQHGKRVVRTDKAGNSLVRVAARDVTLQFGLTANDSDTLVSRFNAFMSELEQGLVRLETTSLPTMVFRLDFVSCTSFAQYDTLAKYAIKFNEPNPKDRA